MNGNMAYLHPMKLAEQYILKQQEPYKSMILHVQMLIENALPKAQLKYKWKIPFYYLEDRPVCYINQSKDYVDIGFYHGQYMTRYAELMVSERRKLVKSLRYRSLYDIKDEVLLFVLKEAEQFINHPR